MSGEQAADSAQVLADLRHEANMAAAKREALVVPVADVYRVARALNALDLTSRPGQDH